MGAAKGIRHRHIRGEQLHSKRQVCSSVNCTRTRGKCWPMGVHTYVHVAKKAQKNVYGLKSTEGRIELRNREYAAEGLRGTARSCSENLVEHRIIKLA